MRIQHNILAMNSYRNYSNNTSALGKNLEKLSSGYKINRAGDDAAGLAISEKMRAQIQGLNAAQKNVKDGISLVKTAEGAMQEIQDMLSRMKYLATQSANGTYEDDVDRDNLQAEVDKLLEEIDRIADSANFNGINLLDGSKDDGTVSISADGSKVIIASAGSSTSTTPTEVTADAAALDGLNASTGTSAFAADGVKISGLTEDITKATFNTAAQETTGDGQVTVVINNGSLDITVSRAASGSNEVTDADINQAIQDAITADTNLTADQKTALANVTFEGLADASKLDTSAGTAVELAAADDTAAAGPTFTENEAGGSDKVLADYSLDSIDLSGIEVDTESEVEIEYKNDGTMEITVGGKTYASADISSANAGDEITLTDGTDTIKATLGNTITDITNKTAIAKASVGTLSPVEEQATNNGKGMQLQIGDTSDSWNQIKVGIGDMHASAMKISGLDISNITSAAASIDKIKVAINYVSSVRGQLGAAQNRLDHTANNLSVMTENIQDAESTIRDTDVADEMMAYTKNNILIQSAQAMLAQANAVPQGVLQLLQ